MLEEFLASKSSKAGRTYRGYASHLNQIKRLMDCRLPVGEVCPEHVRTYLNSRIEHEGVHKATANKELTTLRSVFSFAQKQDYTGKNPARMVDRFSLDAQDKQQLPEPVYIPREIYEALIHSRAARSHQPVKGVMFILYQTGLRIGELLRLRWKDIDLANNVIHVTASMQKGGDRSPYMVSRQLRLYMRIARRDALNACRAIGSDVEAPFDRMAVIASSRGRPWGYSNLFSRVWGPFLRAFRKERPRIYRRLQEAAGSGVPFGMMQPTNILSGSESPSL